MVYLAKPVIKKGAPGPGGPEAPGNTGEIFEERRMPAGRRRARPGRSSYDGEDYQPHTNYRAGPMPQEQGDEDMKIVEPRESRPAYGETSVQRTVGGRPSGGDYQPECPGPGRDLPYPGGRSPGPPAADGTEPGPRPRPVQPAAQAAAPVKPAAAVSSAQPAAQPRASAPVQAQAPAPAVPRQAAAAPVQRAAQPAVQAAAPAKPAPRAEQPKAQDDFFAKYDDPEYINRRLAELKREREQQGKQ